MDYLQYNVVVVEWKMTQSFKPYYKWITFNITVAPNQVSAITADGFKPYYKWITFNIK